MGRSLVSGRRRVLNVFSELHTERKFVATER